MAFCLNQKSKVVKILECLEMLVNFKGYLLLFGIFYVHLVYFVVILVYFSSIGMLYQEKSGNPDLVVTAKSPQPQNLVFNQR
jgi:hypothetical protein